MAGPPIPRRRLWLLAALAAAVPAGAEDEAAVEYQVKAAFVCKFGNYVDWPAQALGAAGEPFRIGVLAGDAVVQAFRRTAAAASVAGRAVEVRRLAVGEAPEGLHALFVARTMAAQAPALLAALHGRPVLTVTEAEASAAVGIVNFVIVDDKVRFDILLPPATQGGLKISARLLGVARRVEGRS